MTIIPKWNIKLILLVVMVSVIRCQDKQVKIGEYFEGGLFLDRRLR